MANPTKLSWVGPTKNTDGSDFTSDQYAGFELELDGEGAVAIPSAWAPGGKYELPLKDLAGVDNSSRTYTVRMRTVAKNGNVSDWSNSLTFAMDFRKPAAPTGLLAG